MAAATTSLPETPGGERNWDYRFTWIRDSSFMLRSLYRLGFDWEAIEYFGFILDAVTDGDLNRVPELQIMYGIGGERDLTERTLGHLSGYRGARPVRVGNGAWNQHQHDVWGMILDAIDVQFRRGAAQIVPPVWEGLAGFVDAALQHWREPDQGIWEVRGEPKHFTASKVLCWVAAARGADLAEERGDGKHHHDRARHRRRADRGRPGTSLQGRGNRHRIRRQRRHVHHLLVLAGDRAGHDWRDRACACPVPKLLSFAGPLGLYAEEIDTTAGEHLGNFPQAFTHLALIEAVSQLIEMEPKGGTAFVA